MAGSKIHRALLLVALVVVAPWAARAIEDSSALERLKSTETDQELKAILVRFEWQHADAILPLSWRASCAVRQDLRSELGHACTKPPAMHGHPCRRK